MSDSIRMMLSIEAGKSKGKQITLKKDEYTIGSSRKSNIRLRGEFVSSEHAILKLRDEGQWVLQNRSSNQSLVNNQIIDTKPLVVGDMIQIGASNLLKFDVVPTKSKKVKSATDTKSSVADVAYGYLKKPIVAAALTFYLIIIVVIFLLLSSSRENATNSDWNKVVIDNIINQSSDYLLDQSNFITVDVGNESTSSLELTEDQLFKTAGKLGSYDSIVWLHQNIADEQDSPIEETVSQLMNQVQQRLMQIWHLEQQKRWSDVVAAYDEVSTIVPNINLPITQKITERRRWAVKKQTEAR